MTPNQEHSKQKATLNQINSRTSEVVRTFNEPCFNFLSLDHKGHFNFNANAKYSTSFESGHILEASSINSLNSLKGIISILNEIKENNNSIFSIDNPDFSEISSLCLLNSSNKNSGTYNLSLSKNNISQVLPVQEINAEIIILASTTNSIDNYDFASLNLLCKEAFTFLPISNASFSVNFDSETIDLNKTNCDNLLLIASLATADQLISSNSSICFFNSSGTDNVIAGILKLNIFNLFNIHNTQEVFKSLGGSK